MLSPLLASRAMLSADKVSMVTMVCWSEAAPAPCSTFVPTTVGSDELAMPLAEAAGTFLFVWVLMCLERWSLRMKRLGHSGQANLFSPKTTREIVSASASTTWLSPKCQPRLWVSPVCVLLWRWSSSERVKRLPQKDQLQTKGRSPVCQRRWALKCDVLPYIFPQPEMWHMCCFFLVGSLKSKTKKISITELWEVTAWWPKIWVHRRQRRGSEVICSSGLSKRLHGVELGQLCVKGRGRKLVQQHTVLLRPCRRGRCRLPDGCVFLEEVGSYPPRLWLCHHPKCLHHYVGFGRLHVQESKILNC